MSASPLELDELLDAPLEPEAGLWVATPEDFVHPNLKLLSHSSSVLLHKCPRKYELYKMTPPEPDKDENDEHTDFGHIVGYGVQSFLEHGDVQRATFDMFMGWRKSLDDDGGERSKKTFWHAIYALDKFVGIRKTVFGNHTIATFDGKPATELGFSIDFGDGFFYRGLLDALLFDTRNNELVVYEGKTTKFSNVHEAVFKHSAQSLGYSLVVDAIAAKLGLTVGSSYKVNYCIYKTFKFEWEVMPFQKNYTQRALWIKNTLADKDRIVKHAREQYFPMHGENCYDFFRPCKWFGVCELKSMIDPVVPVKTEKLEKYQFHFSVQDLINSQLQRQGAV